MASSPKVLRISGQRPRNFGGSLVLPPSKSYLHRALFITSLTRGKSSITNCGLRTSDDVKATIKFLVSLGAKINRNLETTKVEARNLHPASRKVFVGGSGTTARLGISFASLASGSGTTTVVGDASLERRPMKPLLDALSQLGVNCLSNNGYLPVVVPAGGIRGGDCEIDGSISSQFVSSLLIACVKAENKSVIKIKNPSSTVSEPYIDATLRVLRYFDFTVHVSYDSRRRYTEFRVPPEQRGKSFRRGFRVPADMSSAAMIIGATLCSSGKVELPGIDFRLPQADSLVVDIAKRFGARIRWRRGALIVNVTGGINPDGNHLMQKLDLSGAPDLVPAVVGMACGLNHSVRVENVGHLRFKESDRLSTIVNGFRKLGVVMREGHDSIDIFGVSNISRRKPILLDPQNDHRMLMAFTIAGLSGRFVAFDILNPGCVKKSYPNFVSDIQGLCGNEGKKILRIGRVLED